MHCINFFEIPLCDFLLPCSLSQGPDFLWHVSNEVFFPSSLNRFPSVIFSSFTGGIICEDRTYSDSAVRFYEMVSQSQSQPRNGWCCFASSSRVVFCAVRLSWLIYPVGIRSRNFRLNLVMPWSSHLCLGAACGTLMWSLNCNWTNAVDFSK